MKTFKLQFCAAIAAALLSPLAHAGLVLETVAVEQAPLAAPAAKGGRHSIAVNAPSSSEGRNVDTSAKVDRIAKMNRQRIDLESRLSSRISQSGETPSELPIVRGMGRDVTFEDALRQILPAGWAAFSDQDLPLDAKVSWSGNRTWPMVLHGLLSERDMRAHVDWKNQEIMFFVPAVKETVTLPVVAGAQGVEVRPAAAAASSAEDVTTASAPTATASAPSAPAVASLAPKVEVKEVVWSLSPEHTLRENLRRWASAANWNLVWNAVTGDTVIDYPVDAKVEFTGELLGTNGAMAKVITAYRDADYPLEIEFFRGNRVVEVRLHRIPDAKESSSTTQNALPRAPKPPKPAPGRPSVEVNQFGGN